MRVALVHDYLNQMGGGEKTLLALAQMFPGAPIYTSIYEPSRVDKAFQSLDIRTSFMQGLPLVKRHHQPFLPLYPFAMESFDLRGYDLVLSDSSAFAKGIVTRPETLHVCYCHTPMRWAWNFEDYIERERIGKLGKLALAPFINWLRLWDYASAARVDAFVANSPVVAARIAKYYRRESVIIPPPVDVTRFQVSRRRDDYFLITSRLVPYKRIDLAVETCTKLGLPLTVIGNGPDHRRLRKMAGRTVTFLGKVSDKVLEEEFASAKALLFPGTDDFGITPVEALAAGTPVIAYDDGGAKEYVIPDKTGVVFDEQSVASLVKALRTFSKQKYDATAIMQFSRKFSREQFERKMRLFIRRALHDGGAHAGS